MTTSNTGLYVEWTAANAAGQGFDPMVSAERLKELAICLGNVQCATPGYVSKLGGAGLSVAYSYKLSESVKGNALFYPGFRVDLTYNTTTAKKWTCLIAYGWYSGGTEFYSTSNYKDVIVTPEQKEQLEPKLGELMVTLRKLVPECTCTGFQSSAS